LNSSAQGVQMFALRSIVKLCDEAGPLLKPMIPEIVDQLLDVLTSLEPQQVNYIGFHVDKNDTQALDESRFHAVRASPVMNAIERCIDLADEGNMALLAPVIFNKIRRAAGLPTKVFVRCDALTLGWLCKVDCIHGDEKSASIPTIRRSSPQSRNGLSQRSQRNSQKNICRHSWLSSPSGLTRSSHQIH
jgi:hypothetical protein